MISDNNQMCKSAKEDLDKLGADVKVSKEKAPVDLILIGLKSIGGA